MSTVVIFQCHRLKKLSMGLVGAPFIVNNTGSYAEVSWLVSNDIVITDRSYMCC